MMQDASGECVGFVLCQQTRAILLSRQDRERSGARDARVVAAIDHFVVRLSQVIDYAARKGISLSVAEKNLSPILGYDNE
jgi:hypothetical protein